MRIIYLIFEALENKAPEWFPEIEYINWEGKTKDLYFIPDAKIEEIILIDDCKDYVYKGQEKHWIEIKQFESPYSDDDNELLYVIDKISNPMFFIAKNATVTFSDDISFSDDYYIFLDIDGVLHPQKADYDFDKNCISALAAALEKIDNPKILISSSWREMYSLDEIKDRISPLARYVLDVTPITEHRADDILKWLEENADSDDIWIALDDESRPFIERDIQNHLLEIDGDTGFTENDTEQLLELIESMRII